jgi:hypothetical protein
MDTDVGVSRAVGYTDGIKEMESCLLNSVKPILRALLRNNIDNPP